MKSSRFLYKHSQKILQKFAAVFAIFAISGQAIFSPFAPAITFAAPGEMPAETLHSAPAVEASVEKSAEIPENSEKIKNTENSEATENVENHNVVPAASDDSKSSEEKDPEEKAAEIPENSAKTETGAIIESQPRSSAIDLSTPENVITSAKNVIANTASEASTLAEKVEKLLGTAGDTLERSIMETKSDVEISTQGATDLSIKIDGQTEAENNRYLVYKITVSNEGPSDANGSNLKINLPEGLRKIVLTCVESNDKTACPNEEVYSDGSREINKKINKLLVGGKLVFDLKAKLPLNPPTSVNFTAEVTVPEGMTDTNIRSNQAILNTRIVGGSADTAVTSFSAVEVADMNPTVQVADARKGTKEIVFNNPQPISYTVRYENEGPGYADGAGIHMYLSLGDNIYAPISRKLEYENMTISCVASEGAVCPAEFKTSEGQENPRNGWKQTGTHGNSHFVNIFHEGTTKVPEMAAHSHIDVTLTFTPKKLTFIEYSDMCVDRGVVARIGIHSVRIVNPPGITDAVTTNNSYDINTLEKIAKNSNTGKLPLPNIDQSCPTTDLAITEVSQGFAGKIETTAETSENGFGQNLIINSPQEIAYTVQYENKGLTAIENARIGMFFGGLPNYSILHFENLQFECEATGGATCPHAYNSSADAVWGTEWQLNFNNYGRASFFREKSERATYRSYSDDASEIVPHLPANSGVKITVKFTPKKIVTNVWNTCGNNSENINLQLLSVGIRDYNDYIGDPNEANNYAEFVKDLSQYNYHYKNNYLAFDNIRTTDMSAANFGKILQKNCPGTDLAVTEVSQSFVGQLPVEIRRSENQYYTYPYITEERPITFTAKYENLGPDSADGARVVFTLKGGNYNGWYTRYKDLQYSCKTTGGATCPVELMNYNENKDNSKTGDIWHGSSMVNHTIPVFPAGSSVEISVTLTPTFGKVNYDTCGNNRQDSYLRFYSVEIHHPSGVANTNNKNDYYNNFDSNNEQTFQRIAKGEIGTVQIGRIQQQNDICKRSQVSVEVETNSPEDNQLMDGREFEYDVIYKNTSDVDVDNIDIESHKYNYAGNGSWDSRESYANIDYSNFSVSCVAMGESVCPVAQPNPSDIPYGSDVNQSNGEWRYYSSYSHSNKDNVLFSGRIPMLKGNSEVRMKVRYTLSNPQVKSFIHTDGKAAYEHIVSRARLNQNTFTSNDGTLQREGNYNHIWMNDTYINNKFVERAAGDGECINPALMTREGTAQTTPNKNMCLYVEVGNAGLADANNFTFTSTIPHGLTNINPSEIKCTVTAGGDTTICGDELYFDPDTRILTGKIAKMKTGGKIVVSVPGRTVDYSSSWKSVNKILPPSGWFERLPDTNISEQSFSINGTDPSITKSASVRTATVGDEFDYTISMRNPDSGESLKNVKITDLIPDSFYYVGTNDIILTGNASAENASPNRDSITENISGQNIAVDADIDAWKRPIKNDEKKLEWGTFAVPVGGSVTVSLRVRVKESYSCSEIIHNSAWTHYSLQNNIAATRAYEGSLVGFDLEDIELIGCKEITANTDIVELNQVVRNGKATFVPDTYNIIENDTLYSPGLTSLSARDYSIKVANIRQLNKQLLYAGASTGISSKGINQMTGGFKYGNRLQGIGGVTPIDKNVGITVFDYNELPDLAIDENGNITWRKNLSAGVYLGAYEICDKVNTLNCSIAPIVVKVPAGANHAPIAVNDSANTRANQSKVIDVLLNDTDPDDDFLVITGVSDEENGQFVIENGKIKFTPTFDFIGTATANYTVSDGKGGSATARIVVLVETNVNLPPVAVNDTAEININTTASVNSLENDSDPEKQKITLTAVNVINNSGTAEIRNGMIQFQPKTDFTGTAVLTYNIRDVAGNVATGVVSIHVIDTRLPTFVARASLTKKDKFSKQCAPNQSTTPVSFSYTISDSYTSNISQADAEEKLDKKLESRMNAEFEAKGQEYANENGTCSDNPVPTFPYTESRIASKKFAKNNCAPDSYPNGVDFTYEITENYVSQISLDDAKQKVRAKLSERMQAEFDAKGQEYANANDTCTPNPTYSATKTLDKNGDFSRQCAPGETTKPVSYTEKFEVTYVSKISQADADINAERQLEKKIAENFVNNGQKFADANGVCEKIPEFEAEDSLEKSGEFAKVCKPNQTTKPVKFTHKISEKLVSKVSLEDAKQKLAKKLQKRMEQEFDKLGKEYAEKNGACETVRVPPISNGGGGGGGWSGRWSNPPPATNSNPKPTPIATPTEPSVPTVVPDIPKEPLFSAPIINGQCVSAVKNLDDPKLIAYYDDLRIINRENMNRQISRVEFIKLVLNAGKVDLGANDYSSHLAGFSDIDAESWYAPYVAYMIATGSMSGQEIINENGEIAKIFRPNDTISRAEASKILSELVRKSDQKLPSLEEIISFEDVKPEESLSAYIQFAFNSCLLHGRNTIDGQPIDGAPRIFEPFDSITLAETSKVLYNITHSGVDSNDTISEFFNNAEKVIQSLNHSSESTAPGAIVTNNTLSGTITPIVENKPLIPMLVPTLNISGKPQTLQDLIP